MQISPRIAKPILVIAALSPAAWLAWGAFNDALGANPIEMLTRETGVWTLRFIVATLLITPLRRITGWNALIKYRRMLGLFAFFYGSVHLLTYVWLDQFFDVPGIVKDVVKRPFITMGMLAFLAMLPLALTSTTGWIRRLGGKRWQMIHRLIYVTAVCGVIHYYWLVKADVTRPIRYGAIVLVLLAARAIYVFRMRRARVPIMVGVRS
jgi:sulfoxide reductase heme-binding subunit YedZ